MKNMEPCETDSSMELNKEMHTAIGFAVGQVSTANLSQRNLRRRRKKDSPSQEAKNHNNIIAYSNGKSQFYDS
jgi:hypothetical protein